MLRISDESALRGKLHCTAHCWQIVGSEKRIKAFALIEFGDGGDGGGGGGGIVKPTVYYYSYSYYYYYTHAYAGRGHQAQQ